MYNIVILYSNVKFTGETIEYDLGQVLHMVDIIINNLI